MGFFEWPVADRFVACYSVPGYLPQLLSELDVSGNGGSTPQPQTLNGGSPAPEHASAAPEQQQRKGSVDGGFAQGQSFQFPAQDSYPSHEQSTYQGQDIPKNVPSSSSLEFALHVPNSQEVCSFLVLVCMWLLMC